MASISWIEFKPGFCITFVVWVGWYCVKLQFVLCSFVRCKSVIFLQWFCLLAVNWKVCRPEIHIHVYWGLCGSAVNLDQCSRRNPAPTSNFSQNVEKNVFLKSGWLSCHSWRHLPFPSRLFYKDSGDWLVPVAVKVSREESDFVIATRASQLVFLTE